MLIPRPEYPRPQMVRPNWLNLNGRWQFAFDPGKSGKERGWPEAEALTDEIVVPFCPESRLSGIGDRDFHPAVWYRCTFAVPTEWDGKRVLLHIGAADHDTTVYLNGAEVGSHHGGFTPIHCDVTRALRPGENALIVCCEDDTRSPLVAGGKQCPDYYSRRCHYTRTTGIWQTVWLEPAPATYIKGLSIVPVTDHSQVLVEIELGGDACRGTVSAHASLDDTVMGEAGAHSQGTRAALCIDLEHTELWEPGRPTLYDLHISFDGVNGSHDAVDSYFGLRSVGLAARAILLNGRPFFQRLVLDQGFYPDGVFTAPDDDALRNDVVIAQGLGFDGARLHQKVFEPRFLYWADRLGYLVWDEFPNWGLDVSDPRTLGVILPQWLEVMRRDRSHPSVVGWCPFNETQPDQNPEVIRTVYRTTKAVDPTRPVIDTSGYQHVETDIYDVHSYQQDPQQFAEQFSALARDSEPFRNRPGLDAAYAGQPYFVSEYGGIWWNPGQSDENAWGYGGVDGRPRSETEFLARYEALTEALLSHPRMCAFCYTQLYDIEQEVNGLYTYDREAKFDPDVIARVNRQKAAIEG